MATFTRVLVTLDTDSGLPEDVITNTWHFDQDLPGDQSADIFDRLQLFYEAIQGYLSKTLNGAIHYKAYDLADAPPRVPFAERSDTFTPSTQDSFPNEVAVCLSYRADYESGTPNARRRGRIFIGPLSVDAATNVGGYGDLQVSSAFQTVLADAGQDMLGPNGDGDPIWAVYSRTTDITETMADAFNDATNLWVDNAFDTVRSRGKAPSNRTVRDAA